MNSYLSAQTDRFEIYVFSTLKKRDLPCNEQTGQRSLFLNLGKRFSGSGDNNGARAEDGIQLGNSLIAVVSRALWMS